MKCFLDFPGNRRSLAVGFVVLLLASSCGNGASNSGGDVIGVDNGTPGDADIAGSTNPTKLTAEIVIDKVKGNAPLTVHLDSKVTGCAEADSEYLWTFGPGTYSTKKSPGAFVFHTLGLFTIEFKVTCKPDGRTAGDSVQVRVLDSAELELSQVKVSSSIDVAPGDVVLINFSLYNRGDAIEEPFKLLVALSKDELYQAEKDIVLKEIQIDGMDDGRYKEVRNQYVDEPVPLPPDTPEGQYFMFVVADPGNVVTETDEDNNVAQATSLITVSESAKYKADLTVTAPDFSEGATVVPGKSVSYSIKIANEGMAEAKNFRYAVYGSVDSDLSEDDIRLTAEDSDMIFSLGADKTVVISGLLRIPAGTPVGKYMAIASVDLNNSVPEESESNNIAVSPWPFEVIEEVILGYDLSLDSMTMSPHDTYLGGSVKVVCEVSNPGNKPTPAIPVAFYISDEPGLNPNYDTKVGSAVAASLPPGGNATLTYVVPMPDLLKPGDYYFSVVLDVDGVLDELDETNNWLLDESPLHVFQDAFVDVGLANLVVHPDIVDAGKEIKVAYDMTNTGSTASGAFINYVVLSQDKVISIAEANSKKDIVLGKIAIDEVAPSTKVERVEKIPVPISLPHDIGTYYVGVIGDAEGDLVADDNKDNQILVSDNPLTVLDPQGGCREDDLEPNNDFAHAAPLEPGKTGTLGLCAGEDWYQVQMAPGQSLIVNMDVESPLYIEPRPYDLDLDILDPQGNTVDRSQDAGDHDKAAVFAVEEGGAYLLRVYPKSVGNQGHYTLDVDVMEPGEGVDLMPVHVIVSPDIIYPGGLINVSATVVNLGLDDSAASTASIILSQDGLVDDGDLVLASSAVPAVSGAGKTEIDETVFLPVETFGGDYHLLFDVDSGKTVDETDESNNLGVSGVLFIDESMKCEDDGYEPNNDTDTATVLPAQSGSYPDLTVCPLLPDVYRIDLPVGVMFSVTVNYEHKGDKGYVAVDLLDGSRTAVMDSQDNSTSPVVGLPYVFYADTYYVRVRVNPAGGKGGPYQYTMTVNVDQPLPGDVCQADVHEPNNGFDGASAIGCGTNNLTMCKKDKDFYRIDLAAGDSLWADLQHPDGQLKAALYLDPKAGPIKSVSGNGSINYVADTDSVVYLAVEPKSQTALMTNFDYALSVDGVPGMDLAFGDVAVNPAEVDQGEDVQLSFQVANDCQDPIPGFGYMVYLSSDDVLDGGDEPLYGGYAGDELGGKGATDVTIKVMAPLDTDPGQYKVLVVLDPEGAIQESQEDNNQATIPLTVKEVCADDPLEPDDAPDEAAFIGPGLYGSLVICPFDVDWIGLHAKAGQTISIDMEAPVASGDLDLRLYRAADTSKPVAVSATQSDTENVVWKVTETGDFLVRINGFLGASAPYKLVVAIE
ncbi:MAG: hypothetical protein GXP54_00920 [Deltaproteobacteria bacterium]|nr:hypothetical protein [Deltaproteobacteria bacterium]